MPIDKQLRDQFVEELGALVMEWTNKCRASHLPADESAAMIGSTLMRATAVLWIHTVNPKYNDANNFARLSRMSFKLASEAIRASAH